MEEVWKKLQADGVFPTALSVAIAMAWSVKGFYPEDVIAAYERYGSPQYRTIDVWLAKLWDYLVESGLAAGLL